MQIVGRYRGIQVQQATLWNGTSGAWGPGAELLRRNLRKRRTQPEDSPVRYLGDDDLQGEGKLKSHYGSLTTTTTTTITTTYAPSQQSPPPPITTTQEQRTNIFTLAEKQGEWSVNHLGWLDRQSWSVELIPQLIPRQQDVWQCTRLNMGWKQELKQIEI